MMGDAFAPVNLLEAGGQEAKGEQARMASIVGALSIADLVKSSLGPKGMDKILQSTSRGCVPSQRPSRDAGCCGFSPLRSPLRALPADFPRHPRTAGNPAWSGAEPSLLLLCPKVHLPRQRGGGRPAQEPVVLERVQLCSSSCCCCFFSLSPASSTSLSPSPWHTHPPSFVPFAAATSR